MTYLRQRYGEFLFRPEALQFLAYTFLLGFLFYAPWAYGSTRPVLVDFLDNGLLFCLGLHVLGLVWEGRFPHYPLIPTACLALLVLQGSWMCVNARSYFDNSFMEFVPVVQPFPDLPGTWDKASSLYTLKTLCAMTAAFLVASDLVIDAIWRWRLWCAMAIAGFSVAFYGLLQKGLGPDSSIAMYHYADNIFFGPYRYHANAGAYLNLIWPAALALLVQSWRKNQAYIERAFWSFCLATGLAACFVNTSKAAAVIAVLMLVVSGFAFATYLQHKFIRATWALRILALILAIGFAGVLVYGGVTNQIQTRWGTFTKAPLLNMDGRLFLVPGVCLRMIPEAGWFGFGPGSFSAVFPSHEHDLANKLPGFWVYAHEDYLQTMVEYGYLGTVLWSVLFFGSIYMTIYRSGRSYLRTHDRIIYRAVTLAMGGVALHSLVDFPLQVASIQLYITMFFALAWNTSHGAKKPQSDEGGLNAQE